MALLKQSQSLFFAFGKNPPKKPAIKGPERKTVPSIPARTTVAYQDDSPQNSRPGSPAEKDTKAPTAALVKKQLNRKALQKSRKKLHENARNYSKNYASLTTEEGAVTQLQQVSTSEINNILEDNAYKSRRRKSLRRRSGRVQAKIDILLVDITDEGQFGADKSASVFLFDPNKDNQKKQKSKDQLDPHMVRERSTNRQDLQII